MNGTVERPHFKAVIDEYESATGTRQPHRLQETAWRSTNNEEKRIFECDFMEAELNGGIIKRFRF